MRTEEELNQAIDTYADMVKRICMVHLKNKADMEDIFQNVFLKYYEDDTIFVNEEHEKAWLIRVTINACKDLLKSFFHSRMVPIDDFLNVQMEIPRDKQNYEILSKVLSLPTKYKNVIYLYYYEEYSVEKIAEILRKKPASVYTLLQRGRKLLKDIIEKEEY